MTWQVKRSERVRLKALYPPDFREQLEEYSAEERGWNLLRDILVTRGTALAKQKHCQRAAREKKSGCRFRGWRSRLRRTKTNYGSQIVDIRRRGEHGKS